MRSLALILSLLALSALFACNAEETDLARKLDERNATIEELNKQIGSLETDRDQVTTENKKLLDENRTLKTTKELGAVELSNLKWEERDDRFHLILRGTVTNTGHAFISHITVKVAIKDETDNIIEADLVNDPDERGKMPMLFFHNAADSLNVGDSEDFEMIIYAKDINATSKSKVKDAIRDHENRVEYTAMFCSSQ